MNARSSIQRALTRYRVCASYSASGTSETLIPDSRLTTKFRIAFERKQDVVFEFATWINDQQGPEVSCRLESDFKKCSIRYCGLFKRDTAGTAETTLQSGFAMVRHLCGGAASLFDYLAGDDRLRSTGGRQISNSSNLMFGYPQCDVQSDNDDPKAKVLMGRSGYQTRLWLEETFLTFEEIHSLIQLPVDGLFFKTPSKRDEIVIPPGLFRGAIIKNAKGRFFRLTRLHVENVLLREYQSPND